MNVALYARVSTRDKGQDPETQMRQLRKYCKDKGWVVFGEYVDFESGCNSNRTNFTKLKTDALHRKFDVILVWKMDRFSRRGIKDVFTTLDYFTHCNISVVSFTEPYLSTDSPMRELLLAVLAWAARMESENISTRVKAGMERARAEGKHLGRPTLDIEDLPAQVKRLHEVDGLSFPVIAKQLGIGVGSAFRAFQKGTKNLSSVKQS